MFVKTFAENVKTRFDTLDYELDRQLSKRKNKKSNWIIERWITRKDGNEKEKGTKECVMKRKLKF